MILWYCPLILVDLVCIILLMNLTDADVLKLLCGRPLLYKDICLVYSPTLEEIATIGLDNFYRYLSLMLIEKPAAEDEEMKKLLADLTDFQYLIMLGMMDKRQSGAIQEAFQLFCHEKPTFVLTPPSIIMGNPEEKRILSEEDFSNLQYLIRYSCALVDKDEDTIELLDTDSEKVRQLKLKLIEGRKQRAKAKAKPSEDNKSNVKFSDIVASLIAGSNGAVNNDSVWHLTYYAFQDQLKRMSWREEFDINTRAAMAGAKIEKEKLTHWIKAMSFK